MREVHHELIANDADLLLPFYRSIESHGWDLCVVPTGHFSGSLQGNQFASTSLVHYALFLALIQKLSLSGRQGHVLCGSVFFLILMETEILHLSSNSLIALSSEKGWPKGGPGWHQKLLLIRLDIDDTVFVLHEMFKAGGGVEYRWDRHGWAHKSKERH